MVSVYYYYSDDDCCDTSVKRNKTKLYRITIVTTLGFITRRKRHGVSGGLFPERSSTGQGAKKTIIIKTHTTGRVREGGRPSAIIQQAFPLNKPRNKIGCVFNTSGLQTFLFLRLFVLINTCTYWNRLENRVNDDFFVKTTKANRKQTT